MKQENNEKLVSILSGDHQDQEYREEAERTVKEIVGAHLVEKAKKRKLSKKRERGFFEAQLPLYLDALERGRGILEETLAEGPLALEEQEWLREYFHDEKGDLSWRIKPKSQDVFEQARFFRNLSQSGQNSEGRSDFWTDTLLVQEILSLGLAQHSQLYREFISLAREITHTEEFYRDTIAFLPSLQTLNFYLEVKEAFAKITSSSKNEDEQREVFVRQILIPEDGVLLVLPKAKELYQSIRSLEELFISERSRSRNTLAVELLINPKAPVTPDSLRQPKTTIEGVFTALKFINELVKNKQPDFKTSLMMVTNQVIAERRQELIEVFISFGINPELGLEYITNLMFSCLGNLPGSGFVKPQDESSEVLLAQPSLNTYYNFVSDIPYFNVEWPAPKTPDLGLTTEEFIRHAIVKGVLLPYWLNKLVYLGPAQRIIVLGDLLSEKKYFGETEYKNSLYFILRFLGMRFSPGERKFVQSLSERTRGRQSLKNEFLAAVLRRINAGDEQLINLLEAVISSNIIREFLKKDYTYKVWAEFGRAISRILHGHLMQEASLDQTIETVKHEIVMSVLSFYSYLSTHRDLEDNLRNTRRILQREIRGMRETVKGEGRNEAVKRLDILSGSLAHLNLDLAVNDKIRECQREYFGEDYQTNRVEYLRGILENSLGV